MHNDPSIDATKAWPWENVRELVAALGPSEVVLLGNPGPEVAGVFDLRGRTTLAQAAAIIAAARCYVGIDSGLMWIAGSLQAPVVGLYGVTDPVRTGPCWGPAPAVVLDDAQEVAPAEDRRPRHPSIPDALARIPAC